jgi:hypothetical protein
VAVTGVGVAVLPSKGGGGRWRGLVLRGGKRPAQGRRKWIERAGPGRPVGGTWAPPVQVAKKV